jgi:hypothetical protein
MSDAQDPCERDHPNVWPTCPGCHTAACLLALDDYTRAGLRRLLTHPEYDAPSAGPTRKEHTMRRTWVLVLAAGLIGASLWTSTPSQAARRRASARRQQWLGSHGRLLATSSRTSAVPLALTSLSGLTATTVSMATKVMTYLRSWRMGHHLRRTWGRQDRGWWRF